MAIERVKLPHILYSCYSQKSGEGEQFVPEHIFSYTISGSCEVYSDGHTMLFKEGEFRFLRKNQLSRFVKFPPPGGEYRSVSIALDEPTLKAIARESDIGEMPPYTGPGTFHLKRNALFTNYIDSLAPYLNGHGDFNRKITRLKVREAVMILLETNPSLEAVLFDFKEPGKVDLEAFMNEHYKFNVTMSHFAYLTGRSLATFKRDFEKVYHTTPNRWIQQRRLENAWYLIKEKKRRSSDVYLEVGFRDFSHFSFAFKKAYGFPPSQIPETRP